MYCGLPVAMLTRPTRTANSEAVLTRIRFIALSLSVLGGLPHAPDRVAIPTRRERITWAPGRSGIRCGPDRSTFSPARLVERKSRRPTGDPRLLLRNATPSHGRSENRCRLLVVPWGGPVPPDPSESHRRDRPDDSSPDVARPCAHWKWPRSCPCTSPGEKTSAEDSGCPDRIARVASRSRRRPRSHPRRLRVVCERYRSRDHDRARCWAGGDHLAAGRLRRPDHAGRGDGVASAGSDGRG